jgi:hypothetical protein
MLKFSFLEEYLMQKKPLVELIHDLEQEMLRLGYTEGGGRCYFNSHRNGVRPCALQKVGLKATRVEASAVAVDGYVNTYTLDTAASNPNSDGTIALDNGVTYQLVQSTTVVDTTSNGFTTLGPIFNEASKADASFKVVLQLNSLNQVTAVYAVENTVSGIVTGNDAVSYTIDLSGTTYQLSGSTVTNAVYATNTNGGTGVDNTFSGIKVDASAVLTLDRAGNVDQVDSYQKIFAGEIDNLVFSANGVQKIDLDVLGAAVTLASDVIILDQNGNAATFAELSIGQQAQIFVNSSNEVYIIHFVR